MAADIPFIADPDTKPGVVYRPAPGLRRLVADNGGPFTYTGTGTYIVGEGTVAVIDPGPALPGHVAALKAALAGETIQAILVTHTHRDHSPAAVALRAWSGAPVMGCAVLPGAGTGADVEEGIDPSYRPDRVLADGDDVAGPGWTLRALATPGHVSNHLCYEWVQQNALFSGDHIMGWATSVVLPPDGDMGAYIGSLIRVRGRGYACLWPTHGQPVPNPGPFIDALIAHRRARESAILACIADGVTAIPAIVARLYAGIPKALHGAAGQSVRAHLIDLARRGIIDPGILRDGPEGTHNNKQGRA